MLSQFLPVSPAASSSSSVMSLTAPGSLFSSQSFILSAASPWLKNKSSSTIFRCVSISHRFLHSLTKDAARVPWIFLRTEGLLPSSISGWWQWWQMNQWSKITLCQIIPTQSGRSRRPFIKRGFNIGCITHFLLNEHPFQMKKIGLGAPIFCWSHLARLLFINWQNWDRVRSN